MQVKEVMRSTSEVIHLDQSLLDAGIRMRRNHLSALAVVDGDEIVGLLTLEDIDATTAQVDSDLSRKAVRDYMSAEIAFCRPTESVEAAHALMQEGGHTRLLVLDEQRRFCGLLMAEDIRRSKGNRAAAVSNHTVTTSGRRSGTELHQPDNYSLRPHLKD